MEDKGINIEIDKDIRISIEMKKINLTLKKLDSKTKKAIQSLIKNAAFMAVSLEDLQIIINEKGYTEEYKNGANQSGIKKCSEVEIYNTMIKNYSSIMKQLTDLLPRQISVEEDGFDEFVNNK